MSLKLQCRGGAGCVCDLFQKFMQGSELPCWETFHLCPSGYSTWRPGDGFPARRAAPSSLRVRSQQAGGERGCLGPGVSNAFCEGLPHTQEPPGSSH